MNKTKLNTFPVVAIGASAGGLKAFEELLSALPPAPGMAFVLVPHLAPQFESHMPEILARSTRLPVSEVKNGERVSPNRIYIIPPNRAMLIKKGVLHLSSSGHKSDWRNPIDSFFRSLAGDQKKRAIGVLLSGEGSDGTDGLQAIKESGGMTFAQDGKTAAHLSMPHSAVVSGHVDFILSPAGIGERLGAVRHGGGRHQNGGGMRSKPGEQSLNKILELLHTAKGVEFNLYKRSTLSRRIQRRMALRGDQDPAKYFRALKADPGELEMLYRDILISVTSFFREPESFKFLKSEIYPRILKNRPSNSPVRIWIPGCSTGEEAYSHAINLAEYLGDRVSQTPFQIFATDVNSAVIEHARIGLYPRKISSYISPERLRRFFLETKDGYRIAPFIRERCLFAAKNLVQDPPFTNLDLVSCRNLLIYLGPALQEKALQIFQYALKPRGVLMLGRAESVGDFSGRFLPLDAKRKVFYERLSALKTPFDFIKAGRFPETESALNKPERDGQGQIKQAPDALDLQGGLGSILPARYIPNGVIVNGEMEILRFLGNTSSYLRPAPGKPGMNLRRMASKDLLLELRAAIHVAKKSAGAVRREIASPHPGPEGAGRIGIEVMPIEISNTRLEYFLILFEERGAAGPEKQRAGGARRGKESLRVLGLKEDLAASGEHLKAIIEEQETTNASLKASNEELLSSNEELQSINEEFETSKEELQSSNEELQSTNEELITSTEEVARGNKILNRANSDLSNFLVNINIPIVLLGSDLTVRRVTPAAERVLDISPDQLGLSIADIKLPLRIPNLKHLLLKVLKTGHIQALELPDTQDRWYYVFLRPYRTVKNRAERSRIDGAVMTFIDITDRKLSEKTTLRLATLVRDSNDAVIICNLKDRIIAWNKGAEQLYGYSEAQALGMNISRLMPDKTRIKARELVRVSASPIEARRRAKNGRILDILLTVTVLRDNRGAPVEVATTERDITEQKRADRELRGLHARVISAQETERKRLARELHDGVGQILSGVKFRLESLPGEIAMDGKAAAKILKVGGVLNRAIAEIRRVSQDLMPSELGDLGLGPALHTLCREFQERSNVNVTLRVQCSKDIAPDLALAFFRIAQEALNNIGRHSKAAKAEVDLSCRGSELTLTVSDNGVGFVPGARRDRRGIGLGNMRARAESVGGAIEINSMLGAGTRLNVRAPISCPEGDAV